MVSECDHLLKLLIIGDSHTGKTSLMKRFTKDEFSQDYISTIGVVNYGVRLVNLHGMTVKLQIYDTSGQDRFCTITSSYYREAIGIIVMYDVTERESFANVKNWFQEIDRYGKEDVNCMLVGNKIDQKKREVDEGEGIELANKLRQSLFMEVSAKDGSQVEHAFIQFARRILMGEIPMNVKSARKTAPQREPETAPLESSPCRLSLSEVPKRTFSSEIICTQHKRNRSQTIERFFSRLANKIIPS